MKNISDKELEGCIDDLASVHGLALEPSTLRDLYSIASLTAEWRRRTDLTSAKTARALVEVTFGDAFALRASGAVEASSRLVDVGAGAGAPTIPYCVIDPSVKAHLIEPRRKRIAFMRLLVGTLGLRERVVIEEGRVGEDPTAGTSPSALRFDSALSRATFSPERWLSIGRTLASSVIVFTAGAPLPPAPEGFRRRMMHDYSIPSTQIPRAMGVYCRDEAD
ncbi:MAG: RsmG family class I SAM-dependent methyltransferase [Myxococcota bacterium]